MPEAVTACNRLRRKTGFGYISVTFSYTRLQTKVTIRLRGWERVSAICNLKLRIFTDSVENLKTIKK